MSRELAGCYVISLRPVGQHAPLRRAAAAQGARVLALSPWKLQPRADAATRAALREALAAERVVFTSPAAVRATAALRTLRPRRGQVWCAVGTGTAAALRRAGVATVTTPARMDSEGLLALPALRQVRGQRIGLVTAPRGRDQIAPALRRRGAHVLRADVYDRTPQPLPLARAAALCTLGAPAWLALSSAEALAWLCAALQAGGCRPALHVAAASERLAQAACAAGFADVVLAASARPRDLVAAMTPALRPLG
jgi:uroporphyrinogen-III synthase